MVFVFWVDDEDFATNHHGAKSFEFYGERFTSTRFCEDDHVGVLERETVEDDEAVVVHVDAIENTVFLGKVGRSEGETGGDGAGVHVAADLELVGTLGHAAVDSLFLLGSSDFRENHLLTENSFDFLLDEFKFIERVGPDGDIETEAEEFFGADLELVAKFLGVADGGFEFWVANFAAFGVDAHGSFKLGDFFAKVFHDDLGVDRINVHGNIENFVDVDERRKPTSVECARVTVDVDGAAVFGAETKIVVIELDTGRRNHVAQGSDSLLESALDFHFFHGLGLGGYFCGGKLFFAHCFSPFLT